MNKFEDWAKEQADLLFSPDERAMVLISDDRPEAILPVIIHGRVLKRGRHISVAKFISVTREGIDGNLERAWEFAGLES
jgi:accessory colonization factor AcfC